MDYSNDSLFDLAAMFVSKTKDLFLFQLEKIRYIP